MVPEQVALPCPPCSCPCSVPAVLPGCRCSRGQSGSTAARHSCPEGRGSLCSRAGLSLPLTGTCRGRRRASVWEARLFGAEAVASSQPPHQGGPFPQCPGAPGCLLEKGIWVLGFIISSRRERASSSRASQSLPSLQPAALGSVGGRVARAGQGTWCLTESGGGGVVDTWSPKTWPLETGKVTCCVSGLGRGDEGQVLGQPGAGGPDPTTVSF